MAKLLLAGELMRVVGVFLAEMQLAVRTAANGRARRGAEASGRGFRQASARLATACTAGKEMHEGRGVVRQARRCTMGEALHDGQAPPRQGNRVHGWQRDARWKRRCSAGKRVPGYFCLGGALRGYILSITSIGTPRIRCSCLLVAE